MKDNFQLFANLELQWIVPDQAQSASELKETEESSAYYINDGEYDHMPALQNHVTEVPDKPYVCQICKQGFTRNEDYLGHCREHDGFGKPHTCPTCNKGFSRKGNLKSHMRTHAGVRPYSCEFCGKGFSRKEDLLGHRLTHNLYFCEVCNISHSQAESRDGCVLHDVVEMYTCELCRKTFARKSNLKAHELTHMGEKPYVCATCNKGFARKEDLDGHTFSHSGLSMFVCDICSRGFNRKSNYELHLRTHSKEIYSCHLCGKTFVRKTSLDNHLKTHDSGSFSCKLCNKTYSRKTAFNAHCRTHHGNEVTLMEDCSVNNNSTCQISKIEHLSSDLGPVAVMVHSSLL